MLGVPTWSSLEIIFEFPWNTATHIWYAISSSACPQHPHRFTNDYQSQLVSLTYGGDFNFFRPKGVSRDQEQYIVEIVKKQSSYFDPIPGKYEENANSETLHSILWLMQEILKAKMTSFMRITEREIIKKDKDFIGKIMRFDWRDRPTSRELLDDE
jgi:hypothetical protein